MKASYGDGSKFYDKTRNRFVFEYRYCLSDGQKRRKSITAKSRKELDRKIREWKKQLDGNVLRMDQELTVAQLNEVWLNSVQTSLKPGTYHLYKSLMQTHVLPKFGNQKVSTLQAVEIKYYLNSIFQQPSANSRHLSARTVNAVRNTWRTMLAWAVSQGLINRNPLDGVRLLREEPKPIKALTQAEVRHLLEVAREGNYYPFENNDFGEYLRNEVSVAVNLAVKTGMRRGEIFGLRWEDFDALTCLIHVSKNLSADRKLSSPKTKSSIRNILLDEDTVNMLCWWKEYQRKFEKDYSGIYENRQHLIFTAARGTPISLDNFRSRQWKALTEAAGFPGLGFHSLRHSHATQLLEAGVNVKIVAERLGHKDVSVTMNTYAHVLPNMQKDAVEAIKNMNAKK